MKTAIWNRKLILLVFSSIISFILFSDQSLAQSSPPGVNKYLALNPPPVPTSATIFSNVSSPQTATPYTYVIDVFYSGTGSISIADNLPAGFVATGCSVFVNFVPQTVSGCPANGAPAPVIGPFTATGSPPHRILVYIAGSFTVGGQKFNEASVAAGGLTGTGDIDVFVDTQPPAFNLSVTKAADHVTADFGDAIVYTTTVTNTSTVDVNLAGIVSLFDRMENQSSSNEFALTWGWLNCVASPGSTCMAPPLTQANAPTLLGPGEAVDIFTTSPGSTTGIPVDPLQAGGVLKVGGTMTITYYAQIESNDPCAPTPPNFKNTTFLALGSGQGNFPDSNSADNTASVTIPLTGLPTACPPPPVKISKRLLTTSPTWGLPLTYQVTVINTSGQNLQFTYEDRVAGAPATTVFDAALGPQTCIPSGCMHTSFSPVTWIGSSPKKLFQRSTSAGTISLPANSSYTITYQVTYTAACAINGSKVKIRNEFIARGTVLAPTPYNFNARKSHIATMEPALLVCDLIVKKQWKPIPPVNPAAPLQFGVPVGTYQVAWINNSSTFGMKLGSLWDVLHIDSPLYATVPLTFSPPSCSGSNMAGWVNVLAGSTGVDVSPTTTPWQGAQAIRIEQANFQPNGMVSCTFTVTAHRPLPTELNCQTQGTPKLWNTALGDMDTAYNPNTAPWKEASVDKRLPLCINVSIQKVPSPPFVLPGDPVNWTISVRNNAPAGNGPIGVGITETVPPQLLPLVSGPSCTPAPGSTCSAALLSPILLGSVNNLAVGQTSTIQMTTSSPAAVTSVKNTAQAMTLIAPGFYYHPRPDPQGSGTVSTAWPALTKDFSDSTVFGPQSGVTLTFTVKNLPYNPAVGAMSFEEKLPLGIAVGPVTQNSCGGAVSVTPGTGTTPYQVKLAGGALAAATASCQFTVPVTFDRCGAFSNSNGNLVANSVNHLTPSLNATVTVACLKQLTGNGSPAAADNGFGCVLYDAGPIKCWGTGALGRPPLPTTAQLVAGADPAEMIDAGPTHVCTITKTGEAQCWGRNGNGQLGDRSLIDRLNPVFVMKGPLTNPTKLTDLIDISAGGTSTCAIDNFFKVWCWGRQPVNYGNFAVQVPTDAARQVSVSSTHICITLLSNQARCWGEQQYGALGNFNPAAGTIPSPTLVRSTSATSPPLPNIASIEAGVNYTCALMATTPSRVRCWGRNDTVGGLPLTGALATGSTASNVLAPAFVSGLTNIRNLTVADSNSGQSHNCVVRSLNLRIVCWGSNVHQQLGSGPPPNWKPPTIVLQQVHASPAVTGPLDASNGKTCAIVGTGTNALSASVRCWGSRILGRQLGDGLAIPTSTASAVTVVGVP